jgi:hypothetical protein
MPTDFLSSVLALDVEQDGTLSSPRRKTWSFVGDVTVTDDPANKRKIITIGDGVTRFATARLVASTALPANTRTGNTLTASANGALSVDGVAVIANDVVLVAAEGGGASHAHNGLYEVVQTGSAGTPFVLTRDADFDEAAELPQGLRVFISAGSTNANTEWVHTTSGAITVNTTALSFVSPEAGTGVNLPANPGDNGKLAIADSGNLSWLGGSATDQMLRWSGSAWVTTSTVKSDGTSLSFGADPSTGGALNLSDNTTIEGRRNDATDGTLLSWSGNLLEVGSVSINDLSLNTGFGRSIFAKIDNSTRLTITSTLTTSANPIGFGASPPSSGDVRLSYQGRINWRNSGGNSINGLDFGLSSADKFWLGSNSAFILGAGFGVGTGGTYQFQVNGTDIVFIDATSLRAVVCGWLAPSACSIGTRRFPATTG